ncbi:MAG: DUF1800 domain-containing protein [bacterium]
MITLDFNNARYLVSRTGFGEEWNVIKRWEGRPRDEVVNHLAHLNTAWTLPPPSLATWSSWLYALKVGGEEQKRAKARLDSDKLALKAWWIKTMLKTQSPLIERMTLFWHGHFTSSLNRVNQPELFLQQNQLFRKHALGDFKALLKAVVYNPAMLLYLDGDANKMGASNENFARELLELYTIGEYNEAQMREVTRALTGLEVDRVGKVTRFNPATHDPGIMSFGGQTKNLTPDDIVHILLKDPRTAQNIARKFWYEFISDGKPDPAVIKSWAGRFIGADYQISALLHAVLSSKVFWNAQNLASRIKSPAELLVGTLRTLPSIRVPIPEGMTRESRLVALWESLGQSLFVPPTPAGWPHGEEWINPQTLPARNNMLAGFSNMESNNAMQGLPLSKSTDLAKWLYAKLPKNIPADHLSQREKIYHIMQNGAYQLI